MITLQLLFKGSIVKELVTDKNEIAIGRDAANDLCIDNLATSSLHARVFRGPDGPYAIEDMNSTNGTFVNGKQIMTQPLAENDQITIGKHTIRVSYKDCDAFNRQNAKHISQSTYMLDPAERDKLMQ